MTVLFFSLAPDINLHIVRTGLVHNVQVFERHRAIQGQGYRVPQCIPLTESFQVPLLPFLIIECSWMCCNHLQVLLVLLKGFASSLQAFGFFHCRLPTDTTASFLERGRLVVETGDMNQVMPLLVQEEVVFFGL